MALLNITALAILFVSAMSMPAAKNRIAKHVLDPLSYSLHNQKLSKSRIKQEGPPLSLLRKSMLQPIASARGLGLRPPCSKNIWETTSSVERCQNISDVRIVFDTVISKQIQSVQNHGHTKQQNGGALNSTTTSRPLPGARVHSSLSDLVVWQHKSKHIFLTLAI